MELSGNLSDFGLADILQILSLSRKTGTLALAAGPVVGKIMIEDGRITYAEVKPGDSLVQRLVRDLSIDSNLISDLRSLAKREAGLWSLETLILESGLVSHRDFREVARDFIQDVVGRLVRLEKGTFGISLSQAEEINESEEIKLSDGLDIAEILLGSAKTLDESRREDFLPSWPREHYPVEGSYSASDNLGNSEWSDRGIEGRDQRESRDGDNRGLNELETEAESGELERLKDGFSMVNLCSVLSELRSQTYEAEISLLVMRYASQVAARGVLLCAEGDEIRGLGQFGITSKEGGRNADMCVRDIRFPIAQSNLLLNVIGNQRPFIGQVNGDSFCGTLLNEVGGGGNELLMFLAPIYREGASLLMVYGDNFPGVSDFQGLEELLVFIEQAGLVVEKINLEKQIELLRQGNSS